MSSLGRLLAALAPSPCPRCHRRSLLTGGVISRPARHRCVTCGAPA